MIKHSIAVKGEKFCKRGCAEDWEGGEDGSCLHRTLCSAQGSPCATHWKGMSWHHPSKEFKPRDTSWEVTVLEAAIHRHP